MINLGGNWGEVHWPDNWTATTVDGKRSAQFEGTLLYVCPVFRAPPPRLIGFQGSRKRGLRFLQQGSRGICSDIACSDKDLIIFDHLFAQNADHVISDPRRPSRASSLRNYIKSQSSRALVTILAQIRASPTSTHARQCAKKKPIVVGD